MATATATKTAKTKNNDRWDLIADRELGVAELGWAIAAANPNLSDYLVLPAGLDLVVPDAATLRRPLTAANPAREDGGEFQSLPADDSVSPITPSSGGNGNYVPLSAVGVTVAPLVDNFVPIGNLPPYPTLASLDAVSTSAFNTAISSKLDVSTFNAAISLKADASAVTSALSLKADASAVTSALSLKADASAVASALNTKVDTSTYTAGLATKVDTSIYTAGLAAKVDTSTYTAGLALKLDASARNAASGVAPLDINSLIPISNIPLNTFFPFTAGASFRGASSIPAVTTTMVQAGVDSSGQPILWMINASATTGNRLKSVTIASNGNIRFTHYADDGTAGNVLEHTSSGNILTNGTVRPGSGTTAFTGAQFVPGSTYFRTDIATTPGVSVVNSAGVVINSTGDLTYSDGERWRRLRDGTDTAVTSKVILSGTLPASIPINTFTDFGTLPNAGLSFLESVWLISVYFQFSDASNTKAGHWQIHGAGIMAAVQWKAGGFQGATTFKMEEHNAADCICTARFALTNANRNIQLAFDKAFTFAGGANSYYRITFCRLL